MCPAFLFKSGLYLEPILLVAVPAAPLSLLALSFRSQDVFGGNCYFSYSLRIGLPPKQTPYQYCFPSWEAALGHKG